MVLTVEVSLISFWAVWNLTSFNVKATCAALLINLSRVCFPTVYLEFTGYLVEVRYPDIYVLYGLWNKSLTVDIL